MGQDAVQGKSSEGREQPGRPMREQESRGKVLVLRGQRWVLGQEDVSLLVIILVGKVS